MPRGLEVDSRPQAAVHVEGHRLVPVRDLPASAALAVADGGAEPQLRLVPVHAGRAHPRQPGAERHAAADLDRQVARLVDDRPLLGGEPGARLSRSAPAPRLSSGGARSYTSTSGASWATRASTSRSCRARRMSSASARISASSPGCPRQRSCSFSFRCGGGEMRGEALEALGPAAAVAVAVRLGVEHALAEGHPRAPSPPSAKMIVTRVSGPGRPLGRRPRRR